MLTEFGQISRKVGRADGRNGFSNMLQYCENFMLIFYGGNKFESSFQTTY